MGDGVDLAARLEGIAAPGAICLSEDAYRQVSGRLDMAVAGSGRSRLRLERPVRVYSLQVRSGTAEASDKGEARAAKRLVRLPPRLRRCWCSGPAATSYLTRRTPATITSSMPATPSGVPTVAVLAFTNVTRYPQYDPLARRIGQKTRTPLATRRSGASSAAPVARPGPPTLSRRDGN